MDGASYFRGIPRYGKLASTFKENIEQSVSELVLNSSGPLHQELLSLLKDEMPSATSLRPILDIVGSGVHRLSEIAAQTQKTCYIINPSINRRQELGLIKNTEKYQIKYCLFLLEIPSNIPDCGKNIFIINATTVISELH